MAVPRNRLSHARKSKRRAHHALKSRQVVTCSNCGARCKPHHLCPACGHYHGREVVALSEEE